MTKLSPSLLFSDLYGSAGELTAYHRDGRCFIRKKSAPVFRGTAAQFRCLAVHRRALAAWREVPHEVQLSWHEHARMAEPHRPPFDHRAHISGHNLFVSAYHGFALLGEEHAPDPQPFESFPPFTASFRPARIEADHLILPVVLRLRDMKTPDRYRLLAKLQLTVPGRGRNPGLMRNFLAAKSCGIVENRIVVPDFRNIWNLDTLPQYQIHARLVLIDSRTGYRSQYTQLSALIDIK